jgi:multicomponent Na+:H+ antiporter subunit F
MSATLLQAALVFAGVAVAIATLVTAVVLVRGPGTIDRAVALDMLGLLLAAIAGIVALAVGSTAFLDVAIGIALVGFLAAVAVARLVEAHARSEGRDG